ncbi:MAG: hypothetical protein ABIV43_02350 [Candidatus Saccharimonadales bacterium]
MTISRYDDIKLADEIQITAVTFREAPGYQRLESYPRRMVYGGREYTFVEQGMRFLVQKGQALIKLFDVSDGQNRFRLRCEGDHWTLVTMQAA